MHVAELWRYPVKSMGGERLDAAAVGPDGVAGDRLVHVEDGRGRMLTARTHPRLLGLRGTLGDGGEPLVNDRPWAVADVTAVVRAAAGPAARLVRAAAARFDVLPLLVATDGAIAALGIDGRRLRPNIVVGGVDGVAERDWPGRRLRIGDVIIHVDSLRGRCVMTTYDPDTQAQDHGVLRRIVTEMGGEVALNCAVLAAGRVAVGDLVELL